MKQAFKKVISSVIFLAALSPLCAQGAVSVYADEKAGDVRYESGSEAEFSRSFGVGPGGSLSVNVDRGDIHIVGADQTSVQIRVVRDVARASAAEAARILKEHHVVLQQHGNEISVTAQETSSLWRGWWWRSNWKVHYEINVPHAFDVRLKTEGGDVEVATLHGNVTAKTEGGRLNFNGIQGKVNGKTQGGDINAVGCRDELQVRTEGGNITVEDFTGKGLKAVTEGGAIVAEFAVPPRDDCTLRTSGGDVTVRIPGTATVNLDAHTDGGTTRTDLPIEVQGRQDEGTLRGTINGGGSVLKLKTEGGNIRIVKR